MAELQNRLGFVVVVLFVIFFLVWFVFLPLNNWRKRETAQFSTSYDGTETKQKADLVKGKSKCCEQLVW